MKFLIVLLFLVTPFLIAARPSPASCSVSPNPTAIQHEPYTSAYAYFTVSASAPGRTFTVVIHEPSPGPVSQWGSLTDTITFDWLTAYAGAGYVEVVDLSRSRPKQLATCTFTVLP